MNTRLVLTCLAATLLLAGCGGSKMMFDYNGEALWSSFRTYDWMPEPRPSDIGKLAGNPNNRTSIKDAVDWAMKNSGLRQETDHPDMLVAYYADPEGPVDPASWGYTYGSADQYKNGLVQPEEWDGGTIIIDLVDARSKELFWRGASSGVINAPNNDKVENSIREVIKKIMAEYPPR